MGRGYNARSPRSNAQMHTLLVKSRSLDLLTETIVYFCSINFYICVFLCLTVPELYSCQVQCLDKSLRSFMLQNINYWHRVICKTSHHNLIANNFFLHFVSDCRGLKSFTIIFNMYLFSRRQWWRGFCHLLLISHITYRPNRFSLEGFLYFS